MVQPSIKAIQVNFLKKIKIISMGSITTYSTRIMLFLLLLLLCPMWATASLVMRRHSPQLWTELVQKYDKIIIYRFSSMRKKFFAMVFSVVFSIILVLHAVVSPSGFICVFRISNIDANAN